MMERDKPSNENEPTSFSALVKKKNNAGPKRQGQGFKQGFKEERKGRCFNCNRFDHYARECPHKKNSPRDGDNNNFKGNGNQRNKYEESNVVEKQKEFYVISALSTACPPATLDHWLIDSGASRHFIGYKEALSNLIEKKTNLEIILGDNATYPVKGIVTVTLHLNQGQTIHLQEVLYVPDLKKNMVSISAMEDKGFKVAFIDGKVRVWKRNPKDAFTLGFRVDGLYQVGGSTLGALTCDTSLHSELWHRRFAHLHYKTLPRVRKMVIGMPDFNRNHEVVCQGCVVGKLTRGPIPFK
eukprot:PITA_01808